MSPPSEFYNITIDGNKVKCLICSIAVGRLDSKIDSIVLDIERIRLVRIEPRNLTAICTAKETNHSHEMLVSSAYCDTVYKTYTKPEFYSVSRYQTLKQPCPLLPDRILGFNFISSLSRSFRYIRVHRFRHPSSLRGVYNPLSIAHLHVPLNTSASDASNVLSDSSSLSTDSSQPISVSSTTSSSTVISQADALTASDSRFELNRNLNSVASLHGTFSTEDHIRPYNFQQVSRYLDLKTVKMYFISNFISKFTSKFIWVNDLTDNCFYRDFLVFTTTMILLHRAATMKENMALKKLRWKQATTMRHRQRIHALHSLHVDWRHFLTTILGSELDIQMLTSMQIIRIKLKMKLRWQQRARVNAITMDARSQMTLIWFILNEFWTNFYKQLR